MRSNHRAHRVLAVALGGLFVVLGGAACTGVDPEQASRGPADATPDAPGVPQGRDDAGLAPDATDATADRVEQSGIRPGDVLYLTGATIVADETTPTNIAEWRNAASAHAALVARPTSASVPSIVTLAGTNERCAVFTGGNGPLAIAAAPALDLGTGDFSVTVVVKRTRTLVDEDSGRVVVARNVLTATGGQLNDYRGFALMTEYQNAARENASKAFKYAARLDYDLGGATAFEVVEPTVSPDARDVVSMYRRGGGLWLRVGDAVYGPTSGADNFDITSTSRPLTIGQSDDDADTSTRYSGQVCAIVLHGGAETDADIVSRMHELRARYPE